MTCPVTWQQSLTLAQHIQRPLRAISMSGEDAYAPPIHSGGVCWELMPCKLGRPVFVKPLVVEVDVLILVLQCHFREVMLVPLEEPSLHVP